MNAHEEEGIFEQRQALMVPHNGRTSTWRTAHFLKPTVKDSMNGPDLKLSYLPLCSESSWPISVSFNGWYDPLPKWTKWVEKMAPKYQYAWKKSGVYEALMGSLCKIQKNQEVVFGVAERWSCETNTFLFQWAEATITLEDMLVLGGFSVLGHPFSMPLENQNLVGVKERLDEAMKSIVKRKRKNNEDEVSHGEWIDYFMDSGDALEHEAFLALWLSRCVLPGNVLNAVNSKNFSIAIYLARGIRIALAPPVLASLYRDLSLLKQGVLATSELSHNEDETSYIALTLWSPIQFVQVWAWERLPPLQPRRKVIPIGYPRLARWHNVNRLKCENLRWVIDGAGDSFIWRPYAIIRESWLFPGFYKDEAQWVLCNGSLSEELETYARCLRVSELVGTDSVEAYLPHRVAMQFGMDQDLPQWVPKSNATPETAWENYIRPVCDAKLYFPPRLFEADVTTRYLKWWERSVLDLQVPTKGVLKGLRTMRYSRWEKSVSTSTSGFPKKCDWGEDLMQIWSCSIQDMQNTSDETSQPVSGNCSTSLPQPLHSSKKRSIQELLDVDVQPMLAVETNGFTASNEGNDPDVPPGLPPKSNRNHPDVPPGFPPKSNGNHLDVPPGFPPKSNGNHPDVPPGFPPKSNGNHPDVPPGFPPKSNGNHPDVPPGFPPKCDRGEEPLKSSNIQHIKNMSDVDSKTFLLNPDGFTASTEGNDPDIPPGFTPNSDRGEEILKSCNMQHTQNRSDVRIKPFLIVNDNRLPSLTEGGNVDVPPGFTPASQKGKEKSQASIEKGYESREIYNDKPFLASKKQRSCSSAEGNGDSRIMEGLLEPMGMLKQSEATIRTAEPADGIAYSRETRSESSVQSEGGFNFDEGSSFLTTKLSDLDMDGHIKLVEMLLAQMKATRSESMGMKQEPH